MYRFSERVPWNIPANSFSTMLAEMRASGQLLLDLTLSNPTEALADYPHSEIANAIGSIKDFRYQPEPFGLPEARQAIIDRVQRRMPGIHLSCPSVALTASTSEGYAVLFKLLVNPSNSPRNGSLNSLGEEILVPTPSYPLFDYLAQLEGVKLRPYRLSYDGSWFIDFSSLEAAVSTRTRAIILVNPNNPTGSFLQRREFERLRDFALEHSLPLISDEVFVDYGVGESGERVSTLMGQDDALSFTLNGLSKGAAMPQMKLGWIIVNGPQAEREKACARLEFILDTYLSVGAPVQLATERLLAIGDTVQGRIRIRIQNNLSIVNDMLVDARIHMLRSEGGWSAILRVPQLLSEEEWITRLLKEHGVVVQPGYFFDMPGEAFLVISLLTAEDILREGIARILALSNAL